MENESKASTSSSAKRVINVGINGMGRMGCLAFRAFFDRCSDVYTTWRIVHVNEIQGGVEQTAILLKYDTVHGKWRDHTLSQEDDALLIDGEHRVTFSAAKEPSKVPWREAGVELVIECTGKFKTREALAPYFTKECGVRKVLVSAPVKKELNLVYGVNHDLYKDQDIVTAASCTTNCIAPVIKVIKEKLGIKHGIITTIHDVTNTQTIVDIPNKKDARRARSALNSLIPTSTGSAAAVTMIFPELTGKLNGIAVRVPVLNSSLSDLVFEVPRETTREEVNSLLKEAAECGDLRGILGYSDEPLVSADYVNDSRSSIVDGLSTIVVDGSMVKILAWYDNEWAYCVRMCDIASLMADSLQRS